MKRPGSPVLFAIVMIATLVIGWGNDRNSCLRQEGVRNSMNELASVRYQEALQARRNGDIATYNKDVKLSRDLAVHKLDCSGPFPATK